jgi:hypothetical protein
VLLCHCAGRLLSLDVLHVEKRGDIKFENSRHINVVSNQLDGGNYNARVYYYTGKRMTQTFAIEIRIFIF